MDFRAKKKSTVVYHPLQFYRQSPTMTISLQEFEKFAVERLKVLKAVETAGIRYLKGSEEYNKLIEKELKKTEFSPACRSDYGDNSNFLTLDHVSHFILRLAYCRSEELKRWFLQQELDLFKYRFSKEQTDKKEMFLRANGFNYTPISEEEKQDVLQDLIASASKNAAATVDTQEFFKVSFTEVFDLVRGRKVFLHGGFAYVPRDDMISIVITHYRTHLSQALAQTSRALPHLEEDNRLLPMLSGLSKRYLGQDYSSKKSNIGHVTAEMIDVLSKQSFPLCMQQLHQALRKDHHLKHGGRMQYGLFLKGIGLSLEEAMRFWRIEFTKAMDGDKFDKQYAYNIRHNYGKEGKRADYTPYSCNKIIMSNAPGQGDFHGCPFRHSDINMLSQRLRQIGINKESIEKIQNYTKGGHYQIACRCYFEANHTGYVTEDDININHPNHYFDESQKASNGVKGMKSSQGTPLRQSSQMNSQGTPKSQMSQNIQIKQEKSQLDDIENMEDDDILLAGMETAY